MSVGGAGFDSAYGNRKNSSLVNIKGGNGTVLFLVFIGSCEDLVIIRETKINKYLDKCGAKFPKSFTIHWECSYFCVFFTLCYKIYLKINMFWI